MIGSKPLDGVNGMESERGRACDLLFPGVAREVQSLAPWAELVKTVLLSPTGRVDPARGAEYNRPKDCLRVLTLNNARRGEGFEEENGFIFYHRSGPRANLPCRYVRLSLLPDEWSAELRGAVRKLLAARIMPAVTKDVSAANSLEEQFWRVDRPRLLALHLNRVRNRRTLNDEDNFS